MTLLYLDLVGGLSGDMCAGAWVDLGVPMELLRERVSQAGLTGVRLASHREQRHQIAGTRFVVAREDGAPADGGLPMPSALSGGGHTAWREIDAQLGASALPHRCADLARRIFRLLAEAEGAIHGVPTERVQFHELGAWDSMADIVCVAAGVEHLGAEEVWVSPVPVGAGQIRTAHGVMPVPAPATLRLLQGFPVVHGGPAFERTTPTGAAILAALARPAPESFAYIPERIGIGIGKAERAEVPNLVRAVLGRAGRAGAPPGVTVERIEMAAANLDDCSPEWIGFAVERLFSVGVLDVALVPIQMKKNRPGTQIQALYPPALRERVLEVLFAEGTTLGVRFQSWERAILPREAVTVNTPWGPVMGKLARFGERQRFSPEFEACRKLAVTHGIPLPEIYRAAEWAFEQSRA